MKKLILSLGLFLITLTAKSQVLTYKADSFYCFSVPSYKNILIEFFNKRAQEDSGHVGRVDYIFNMNDKTVTVKSLVYKSVTNYKLIGVDSSNSLITRYIVRDGDYEFYFLASKQPDKTIVLYCLYPNGDVTRGWQSLTKL